MARSLRSSRQKINKTLKRSSVFGDAVTQRENRIAEKLHESSIDEILSKQTKTSAPTEAMEVEAAAPVEAATQKPAVSTKKSTGGWSKRKKSRKSSKKSRK